MNLLSSLISSFASVSDTTFIQEYHRPYPMGSPAANDVRTILVDDNRKVWAGTRAGLFVLDRRTARWSAALDPENQGTVFDLNADHQGNIWIAAWNGLYKKNAGNKIEKITGIPGPVSVVNETGTGILAMGPAGIWQLRKNKWTPIEIPFSREDRCLIRYGKNGYCLGTGRGVYLNTSDGIRHLWKPGELISDNIFGMDFRNDQEIWIGGLGGITIYDPDSGKKLEEIIPAQGLTNIWVRCIQRAPGGTMRIGTDLGILRIKGDHRSLRHSRRWLLNDHVRDTAFDKDGNDWIATAGGVSAIMKKPMTLVQKADYYESLLLRRHVRPPGLVEKCRLRTPGDTITWEPMDDDNDGQYTSMYLAMESYRYAVTGDPEAKKNAINAFHALKFLQTVTGTAGFVARSVIPVIWKRMADLNETISNRQFADRMVHNPREKKVEKHWRPSKDGKWLWKGDTSSDESTGHMYGYTLFYELIARKDPTLKKELSDHIQKIMDYIINNGYILKDIDGTHTKWGVWAPRYLNDDLDWATEQGINSLEILSYLKLAWHVSGSKKYQQEYEKLLNKYHYRDNVLQAKSVMPAWRTFIDDELVALAYPALMMYEKNPDLRAIYSQSMENWYQACKDDDSPFYYYTIDAFLGKEYKPGRSVFFLRDNPLDLIRWRVDNSQREDLHLTHSPILEDRETSRLVPPDERGIMRWDKNPWAAVQGDMAAAPRPAPPSGSCLTGWVDIMGLLNKTQ